MTAQELDTLREEAADKMDNLIRLSAYPEEREWLQRMKDAMRYDSPRQISDNFRQIEDEGITK
jgi:hypothetical protein